MKRLISLFVLLFVACNSAKTTDSLLAEVWEKDQSVRLRLAELTKAVSVEGRMDLIDSLVSVVDEQQHIDEENMAVVDSLLYRGLPMGLSADLRHLCKRHNLLYFKVICIFKSIGSLCGVVVDFSF